MGTLSILATPIGNLEDITLRALDVLKACDVIYAEDTRVIAKLLSRYEIEKPVKRLDAATEAEKTDEVLELLSVGKHVVYVSDAGTPGISDPGARLVAAARKSSDATIEAIPGPSALTAALSIAGVNTTAFTFLGFLPHKKGRKTAIEHIGESEIPVVLYESPHRVEKLLSELAAIEPSRVVVARELTKMHEEIVTGSLAEVEAHFAEHPETVRGEFVVIIVP